MNHLQIVQRLIFYGADVCMKTTTGRTPHDLASSDEVLQCLRNAMSDDQRASIGKIKSTRCSIGGDEDEDEEHYRELEIDSKYDLLMGEEEDDFVCAVPKKVSPAQLDRRRMSLCRRESEDQMDDSTERRNLPFKDDSRFRLLGRLPSFEPMPGPPPEEDESSSSSNRNRKNQKKKKKRKKKRKERSRKNREDAVDEDAPKMFLCEICGKLMRNPAQCPYGHVYERDAIRSYLRKYGYKCPFSGLPLSKCDLMPAAELQHAINEYKENRKAEKLRSSTDRLSPCLSSPVMDSDSEKLMMSKDNDTDENDDLYDFS